MVWSPPGEQAPTDRWRYDLAKKAFTPPGTESPKQGAQAVMPESFNRTNPHGFHLLTSPPGNQAPIEHINYTPDTGQVHGRGQMAPKDKLNYSLIPESALSQGAGHTAAGGRGGGGIGGGGGAGADMGAGAGPFSTSQRGPFAGTPPLSGSPTLTGPSATLNRAQPQWGGGGTPMSARMGMGQSDGTDSTSGIGDVSTSDTSGSSTSADSNAEVTVQDPDTGQSVQGIPVKAPDGTVVAYQVPAGPQYTGQPAADQPKKFINAPQTKPGTYTHWNTDGSIDVVTVPAGGGKPTNTHIANPDSAAAASIRAKDDAATNLSNAQAAEAAARTSLANAQTATEKATAQTALAKAQADLITAQNNALKAGSDAAVAQQTLQQKAGAQGPSQPMVGSNGNLWTWNNDTKQMEDTGFTPQTLPSDKEVVNHADGSQWLLDKNTNTQSFIAPTDPYKQYPPMDMGNSFAMWDPTTQTLKPIGNKDPAFTYTWRDGVEYQTNPQTGETQVMFDAGPTMAEADAHTSAIDQHNQASANIDKTKQDLQAGRITMAQARVNLEDSINKLLNPQPYQVGHMIFAPPGYTGNMQTYNPQTKQFGTEQISGGPLDPSIKQTVDQLRSQLSNINYGDTSTTPSPMQPYGAAAVAAKGGAQPAAKSTQASQPTQQSQPTQPGQTAQAPAAPLDPGQAGVPGQDPNLSGQLQPPHDVTTASGDIAHYDAGGALMGITYLNTTPPNYGEPGYPGSPDYTPPEDTSQSDQPIDPNPPPDDSGGDGTGHEMGSGAVGTPGGWVPRPQPFSRATGPGWLGGVGSGQTSGTTTAPPGMPAPPPANRGELPSPPPLINTGPGPLPGPAINTGPGPWAQGQTTDQNVNWIPNITDIVKQQVDKSLKELLGYPELGSPEHEMSPDPSIQQGYKGQQGLQGGHSLPETAPVDPHTGQVLPPEPTGNVPQEPGVQRWEQIGPGMSDVTAPEDLEDTPPITRQQLEDYRQQGGTAGTGQEAMPPQPMPGQQQPGGMPGGVPDPRQILAQAGASANPNMPKWLQMLLRKHPELLQMAAGKGGPQPPSPTPPTGGAPSPPMGQGQDQPPAGPGAPPPQAPGPGGAPMQPPVPPQDVAGIGHRFGQQMDVGEPQHSGVDLQAPEGTPTQSPVDGFVQDVTNDPQGLGLTVVIQGKDGSTHKLGHLKSTKVYRGMQVQRGQDLASEVGSTGLTTGAHLHWGVKDQQGQPVDPTQALGPMAQMPPVPGTEQMGPPGGSGAPGGGGAPPPAPPMGGGQQAAKPMGWQPKPRARRRWGKPDPSKQQGVSPRMGQGHMSNARNPLGYGVGQDAGGTPTNYQSPDYQAGYQAGMQAAQSPGTPPLFVPGMAQPVPGAQDMSQGFGQQQGGGQ